MCVNFPWREWRQLRGGSTLSAEGGAECGDGEPRGVSSESPSSGSHPAWRLCFQHRGGGSSLDIRPLSHLRSRSEQMIAVESSGGGSLPCSALL